jgi:hypothetical protein
MGDEKSKAQEMRRQYNRHSHGYTSTNMEEDDLISEFFFFSVSRSLSDYLRTNELSFIL